MHALVSVPNHLAAVLSGGLQYRQVVKGQLTHRFVTEGLRSLCHGVVDIAIVADTLARGLSHEGSQIWRDRWQNVDDLPALESRSIPIEMKRMTKEEAEGVELFIEPLLQNELEHLRIGQEQWAQGTKCFDDWDAYNALPDGFNNRKRDV